MTSEAFDWLPGPEMSTRDAALIYAAHGLRVVILHGVNDKGHCTCQRGAACGRSAGKHPRLTKWPEEATTDAETIRRLWKRYPRSNVGLAMGGAMRIVALDIDGDDGRASLLKFTLPPTLEQVTGSGGEHRLFIAPADFNLDFAKNTAGKLAKGLDVRGTGGQIVVAPSRSAMGLYTWRNPAPPAPLPDDLGAAIAALSAPQQKVARTGTDARVTYAAATGTDGTSRVVVDHGNDRDRARKYAEATLAGCVREMRTAPKGTRNDTLNKVAHSVAGVFHMGLHPGVAWDALYDAAREAGLPDDRIEPTLKSGFSTGEAKPRELPERTPRYAPQRRSGSAPHAPVTPHDPETGEVIEEDTVEGVAADGVGRRLRAVADAGKTAPTSPEAQQPTDAHAPTGRVTADDVENIINEAATAGWEDDLRRTPTKIIKPTMDNAVTILACDPRWTGVLAFNEFRQSVTFQRPPPFHATYAGMSEVTPGTPLTDQDCDRVACWIQRAHDCDMGTDPAGKAAALVARRQTYHPVREYLRGLSWDGTPRVATWLHKYLGAANTKYTRHVGGWFLIGAVARVEKPGAKVDHMLILQDRTQGTGKSSALAALGGEWFADTPLDLKTKDAFVQIQGTWIQEIPELDAFDGVSPSRIKAFLSSRADKYRPPYGRGNVEAPRQIIFAGTTNQREILKDPTGDRRYHPVRTGRIDIDALARDRDQLWAEALHLYRKGMKWWPHTPELVKLCTIEQEARYQAHPWEDLVAEWLVQRALLARDKGATYEETPVSVGAVLSGAIGLDKTKWNQRDTTAVGEILARMKWLAGGRPNVAGQRTRVYVPSAEFLAALPPAAPANDDTKEGTP